jgi:acetyltransferase-like isoleucine patch superfamily enzyme
MKSIFLWIEDLLWSLRCSYGFKMHGPYGLSAIIEKIPYKFLVKYLRKYGATIGDGGLIERGIYLHRPFGKNKPFENLKVGNNVYLGHRVIIDLTMPVTFNNASSIGSRVQIWTHSGYFNGVTVENRDYKEDRGEVVVEEGAMVYSNSLIKHGIRIGAFASIAACSMVNRNVEPYAHASGVPIKVIQKSQMKD